MFEKIREIIVDQLDCDPDDVKKESSWEEIGADSLDIVDIVMTLEENFNIDLPEDEMEQITTIGALISLVEKKMQE